MRSLIVSFSSLSLAAIAHLDSGGHISLSSPLILVASATVAATWTLSHRQWTFAKLAALAFIAQSAFHLTSNVDAMNASPTMTVTHVVASLVLAFAIARLDRKLFCVATLLTARLSLATPARCWPQVIARSLFELVLTFKATTDVLFSLLRGPPMISSFQI